MQSLRCKSIFAKAENESHHSVRMKTTSLLCIVAIM